jgi:hypothetical protein
MENKGLIAGLLATLVALAALALVALQTPSVVVTGGGSQAVQSERFGGTTGLDSLTLNGSLTVGTSGSAQDLNARTTFTVDPDSIAANSVTSSAVTLTGAAAGDHCSVSGLYGDLTGSTSTAVLNCVITGSNTATVYYRNVSSTAAYNAGSAVLSIKAESY